MNENNGVKYLKPFKRFCMSIGELPTSYLETMSYYEMLVWLTKYLGEQVIPTVNNNGEVVSELQSFVENYFDNLDVQEEIDNKLDEMAESGQLTDIIAQYLGLAGMITFSTFNEMSNAENLVNGSKCRTLGFNEANDSGGATYLIRTTAPETYYETLANGKYAELIVENTINLMTFYGKSEVVIEGMETYRVWNEALSSAFEASNGNAEIIIPSGTFYLNDTVQLPFNITIRGVNQETSIFKLVPYSNCDMFHLGIAGTQDSSKLINLTIHGDFIQNYRNEHSTQSTTGNGVVFVTNSTDCDGCIIDNCYIENFAENGVVVNKGLYVITVKNSQIRFNRYNGIYNNGTDNFFDNLRIYFNGLSGIKNYLCGANKFSNIKVYYNCALNDLSSSQDDYNATLKKFNAGIHESGCSRNEYVNIELQDNYYTGMTFWTCDGVLFDGTFDDDGFSGQSSQSLSDEIYCAGSKNLTINAMLGRNDLGYVAHLIETFNTTNSSIIYTRAMEAHNDDPNVSGDLIYKTGTQTDLLIIPNYYQLGGKIFTQSVSLTFPAQSSHATQINVPLGFTISGKTIAFVNLYTSYNVGCNVNINGSTAYIGCTASSAFESETTVSGTLVVISM